ncbi:hypothetical protein [Candidatus Palibaumannia cicadellinicola]|uniref:Uncharacterized protein n=1 Tax=Candidatus Palibaumannia cicadellinicola TaxID=186490 RepID=A0A0K2BKD5_9GAMM|nr:hypothetical protein [Candidatus Baumannia cicadellinicola]AKZ65662.1 hypothetical protein AB162_034 [Candidatus Baumannia cicadellinicola]
MAFINIDLVASAGIDKIGLGVSNINCVILKRTYVYLLDCHCLLDLCNNQYWLA